MVIGGHSLINNANGHNLINNAMKGIFKKYIKYPKAGFEDGE